MPNPKLCAICGYTQATTRDHIPPKGVFPKPLPVIMLTVPACAGCNNGASEVDERFRLYLAAQTAHFQDDATRLWKKRALRSLQSNKKLMREFARNVGARVQIRGSDGAIEERLPLQWPVSAYVPVIERMVRGLFYHHFDSVLGKRGKCDIHMLHEIPQTFHDATNGWIGGDVGGQIFVYRFAKLDDIRSYWIFQFFDSHWATAETYPADGEPIADLEEAPAEDS